jgi:hypothetical protein
MQLQEVVIQLRDENAQLRKEAEAAANLDTFKARYRYEETVSWKYDESGQRIDGPFCPNCVDEGMKRRLNPGMNPGSYQYPHHKTGFHTNEFDRRRKSPATVRGGRWGSSSPARQIIRVLNRRGNHKHTLANR